MVLKPAATTPVSAMFIAAALLEAGLPAGRIQLVVGPGRTVGDRLVRDPRVRYVTFTGSTEVGRHIRAVSGLARTQLELGSNSPTIVWSDADLDLAARLVAGAGYRKSGQVCTSVQRLIVHRAIAEELVDRLAAQVAGLGFGDPRAASTTVGPLIDAGSADRARALIDDAVGRGARLVVGGTSAGATGAVIAPTLLADVGRDARLSQQEAFAPIVGVTRADSFDEAVSLANATPYGLQAGVFCTDLDVAFSFARTLEMGGVIINDTSSTHPDAMPYGGVKESGHGVEGPRYAVQDMTDSRAVMLRLRPARSAAR
jgi:succinate-semialdehyde dehydrogenase/glutarate-semialdehyde dehydrogenase